MEETHISLVESPSSITSEAYRTVRTSLQFQGMERRLGVIGVTSAAASEGKTTIIANLSVSLARAGQRVVVVSCDLRRPRLHRFFGVPNESGLTSVILGEVSLAEAVAPVGNEPRLQVLASGPVPPNPAEILTLDRLRQLIDWLSDQADVVLLDCPPVLPVTDALLLSRLVDGMMVIASAETTKRRDLRLAVEMLRQVDAPLLGLVLNCVPAGRSYTYGYYNDAYAASDETDLAPADATPIRRRAARKARVERAIAEEAEERIPSASGDGR